MSSCNRLERMEFEIQCAAVTGGFAACHISVLHDKCKVSSVEVVQNDGLGMWLSMELSIFKISHRLGSSLEFSLKLTGDGVTTIVRHDTSQQSTDIVLGSPTRRIDGSGVADGCHLIPS